MKKLLFLLLLCVVVIGFWRGWFSVSSHGPDGDNKVDVNLTVDPDKAKEDVRKVGQKTTDLGEQAQDTVQQDHDSGTPREATSETTPGAVGKT